MKEIKVSDRATIFNLMVGLNGYTISYGCYTGNSMSASWQKALGLPLWGNTESTRYYPVGDGKFPEGGGKWVH